jgi:DNA mismatch repair protein MutS2
MIEHTYQVLEYHRLLNILSHYASCPLGQSKCLSLKPSNDAKYIDNELRLVSELRLLLKVKGFVSFSELTDISAILKKSGADGSCLEPVELLCVLGLAKASRHSKKFLASNRSLCPGMYGLVSDIADCGALIKAIEDTISLSGVVKDSASPLLKKIRRKKIRLRSDLERGLQRIRDSAGLPGDGQDHLVTVRDGRYVISLRSDKKSRIQGIIHGYSKTRSTCFLEPVDVIQDNNRMAELAQEEKAEEFRILIGLTGMVSDFSRDLHSCQALISRLDGLYARARFSKTLSCVAPEVGEGGSIELIRARNPILMALAIEVRDRGKRIEYPVSVDISLDGERNGLIISGPNRGGKTVALKTLGLMCLMVQAGIHVPVDEGSRFPVFNQIMAEIGDDQDIQAGRSTFSAHAANLKYLTEHADQKSLAIIDEPGMGTDPDEGVALAMAVFDSLCRRGTFVAVSTHLNRLKSYGLLNPRVLNAAVEFDLKRNCPTFKLKYGSPGISHALEIARDVGVPADILDRAKGYLDNDEIRLNRLIEKLNYLRLETEREKTEAEEAKRTYQDAEKEIKNMLTSLEVEERALIEKKRVEAETAIKEAREELRQAVNLLKSNKESSQAYVTERYGKIARRLLRQIEPTRIDKVPGGLKQIEEGQMVYHSKLKQKGTVLSIDPSSRRAQLMLGKVKMSAEIQDLEIVKGMREPGLDDVVRPVSWGFKDLPPRELNVIGYRVDDAIPLIDKTLDRALVEGHLTLRIIHGFGTGRLRKAIREHLKEVNFVKSICSADPKSGGDAITIVELS